MGHSRGGGYALLFAARCPDRTAGLILADYSPAQGLGRRGVPVPETQSVGNKPRILPTKEQALASTSRKLDVAPGSWIAARLDAIVREAPGGFTAGSRDPDYSNQVPVGATNWKPALVVGDLWLELARVICPVLVIKALHSHEALEPGDIDKIRKEFPKAVLREIDSVHDMAAAAPEALISILRGWLK
jgi:pimeloyl-ACP methyl ester carboxylesterase